MMEIKENVWAQCPKCGEMLHRVYEIDGQDIKCTSCGYIDSPKNFKLCEWRSLKTGQKGTDNG